MPQQLYGFKEGDKVVFDARDDAGKVVETNLAGIVQCHGGHKFCLTVLVKERGYFHPLFVDMRPAPTDPTDAPAI